MRLALLAMLLLAGLTACSPANASERSLLDVGEPAPDVTLTRLDGATYPLSSLRGRTLVLNFWFHGCPACRAEMPELSRLSTEVTSRRPDVAFLSVNVGDPPDVISQWWQQKRFAHLPLMQSGDSVSQAFGVRSYPTNYVIGPDGSVLWRGVGWDEAGLRGALGVAAR
jgi:peroxiredoxin